MKIELLYFDGCPNHEAFMPRLRTLLDRAGVDEEVRLMRVESDEEARAAGFLGSPSLRIDGRDVEAGAAERSDFGLKCRLYQTPGGLSGTPPDELVLAALTDTRAEMAHGDHAVTHRTASVTLLDEGAQLVVGGEPSSPPGAWHSR